jgi:UDP-N-acetylmuramate--alanine ligase
VDLDRIQNIYFLGIGGIGMSALARYFKAAGKRVAGYDLTATALTGQLSAEGIPVAHDENPESIPAEFRATSQRANTLVVVTPAVPAAHAGLQWFRREGYAVQKRAEVLGRLTRGAFTVAVAGTHGKTTTSSMVAQVLHACGVSCTAFLGGVSKNFGSNLLLGSPAAGEGAVMVVEADEYDRSFLHLRPRIAVVTSMDADHLDIYGDAAGLAEAYNLFAAQTAAGGTLIHRQGLALQAPAGVQRYTYSLTGPSDFRAANVSIGDRRYRFDFSGPGAPPAAMTLSMPGRHNLENAVAALAVGAQMNLPAEAMRKALAAYEGVHRRFDFRLRHEKITLVDDYAHHPTELTACIAGLRELYPGKKITGVFQPHLYSRTRDFADGFAASLSALDELVLLPVYPARERPLPGVTSKTIFDRATLDAKALCEKAELAGLLAGRETDVVVMLGAGDIDQLVEPVRRMLVTKYKI